MVRMTSAPAHVAGSQVSGFEMLHSVLNEGMALWVLGSLGFRISMPGVKPG